MSPATAPNGQSMKKYGKQILNGASQVWGDAAGWSQMPGRACLSRDCGAGVSEVVPRTGDAGWSGAGRGVRRTGIEFGICLSEALRHETPSASKEG